MSVARRRSGFHQWRKLRPEAQRMRRQPTPAEEALWHMLRGRRLRGAKFRRQHPVGPFIVDFVCLEAGLVVEVDGEVHDNQVRRDDERAAYLQSAGLRVLRVRNDEVLQAPDVVESRIDAAISAGAEG